MVFIIVEYPVSLAAKLLRKQRERRVILLPSPQSFGRRVKSSLNAEDAEVIAKVAEKASGVICEQTGTSGVRFTKAENMAVRIFDVKIEAGPRSLFKRLDYASSARFQFSE